MKPKRYGVIRAAILLLLPGWLVCQTVDLMQMKKQEEERRKKTEKSKIVVSDTNINTIKLSSTSYGFVQVQPGDVAGDTEAPPAEASEEAATGAPVEQEAAPDEQKDRAYWKSQQDGLLQRIAELERAIADDNRQLGELQNRYLMSGFMNEQLTLNQQIEEIRKQLTADQTALDEARQALDDLAETARKQGIPSSWLED